VGKEIKMIAAFILVNVAPGFSGDVEAAHKAAHAVPGVKTVHFLLGPIDAIAYVEVKDMQALGETIRALHAVPGVGATDTRLVLPI
jgi:DNA-binding Lrp family transcriptional regulator